MASIAKPRRGLRVSCRSRYPRPFVPCRITALDKTHKANRMTRKQCIRKATTRTSTWPSQATESRGSVEKRRWRTTENDLRAARLNRVAGYPVGRDGMPTVTGARAGSTGPGRGHDRKVMANEGGITSAEPRPLGARFLVLVSLESAALADTSVAESLSPAPVCKEERWSSSM